MRRRRPHSLSRSSAHALVRRLDETELEARRDPARRWSSLLPAMSSPELTRLEELTRAVHGGRRLSVDEEQWIRVVERRARLRRRYGLVAESAEEPLIVTLRRGEGLGDVFVVEPGVEGGRSLVTCVENDWRCPGCVCVALELLAGSFPGRDAILERARELHAEFAPAGAQVRSPPHLSAGEPIVMERSDVLPPAPERGPVADPVKVGEVAAWRSRRSVAAADSARGYVVPVEPGGEAATAEEPAPPAVREQALEQARERERQEQRAARLARASRRSRDPGLLSEDLMGRVF